MVEQPAEDFARNGLVRALQWLKQLDTEAHDVVTGRKREAEENGLLLAMDSVRIKDVPRYLTEKLFERPHMKLLVREIDESVELAPRSARNEESMWIAPMILLDLLIGKDSQVACLDKLLDGISFLH